MPPRVVEPVTLLGWILPLVFLGLLAWGAISHSPLQWILGGALGLLAILTVIHRLRLRRIRRERREESICTFARSLPAREHDTWIARAVYEEVAEHATIPLRPDDDLLKICGLADDDLDDAIARIAARAGRSLESTDTNPYLNVAPTVANLVRFLEHQPRLPAKPPIT